MTQHQNLCSYIAPDKSNSSCQRQINRDGGDYSYCIFHSKIIHKKTALVEMTDLPDIQTELYKLIRFKDGNWKGFIFPSYIKIRNITIDFPIDARWASFTEFDLLQVTFTEPVNFTSSTFFGRLRFIDGTFESQATFDYCQFKEETELQRCKFKARASFDGSSFDQRAQIKAQFDGPVNFNDSTFREAVHFCGLNPDRKYYAEGPALQKRTSGGLNPTILGGSPIPLSLSLIKYKIL